MRKLTSLPARMLRLADRGQLQEGFAADITIFDPNTVAATNSLDRPKSYSKGIHTVIVNGAVVLEDGRHTGARPGQVLLGKGYTKQR